MTQCCNDGTTSDHKPVLFCSNIETKDHPGRKTHWNVFNCFLAMTQEFWEKEQKRSSTETFCSEFVDTLASLRTRCPTPFPRAKYRTAISKELRVKLSEVRALSLRLRRTGDTKLRLRVRELRKENRRELNEMRNTNLQRIIEDRNDSNSPTNFWSKARRQFKPINSLQGLIDEEAKTVKDAKSMCELAAKHYEKLFAEVPIFRPHPYVDSPPVRWENWDQPIPPITRQELMKIVRTSKKKTSTDAHGISSFMFNYIPSKYWDLLLPIYNESLVSNSGPSYWKAIKMILIAKKDPICAASETRPISLLDPFLKVFEKLFLLRFNKIVLDRGILHHSQSGFRQDFRLQSRVLTVLDQIAALMNTGAPVATLFVDFRQAFDQLWWDGCLGKLASLGLPAAYIRWLDKWLRGRNAFIQLGEDSSRPFPISRGGPQGSCLTPALFICYHSDMWRFLELSSPNFFADDLACVLGGPLGMCYNSQCTELEKKVKRAFEHLEYYSSLSAQPINYKKTEMLWSARAIGAPRFEIAVGGQTIAWVRYF